MTDHPDANSRSGTQMVDAMHGGHPTRVSWSRGAPQGRLAAGGSCFRCTRQPGAGASVRCLLYRRTYESRIPVQRVSNARPTFAAATTHARCSSTPLLFFAAPERPRARLTSACIDRIVRFAQTIAAHTSRSTSTPPSTPRALVARLLQTTRAHSSKPSSGCGISIPRVATSRHRAVPSPCASSLRGLGASAPARARRMDAAWRRTGTERSSARTTLFDTFRAAGTTGGRRGDITCRNSRMRPRSTDKLAMGGRSEARRFGVWRCPLREPHCGVATGPLLYSAPYITRQLRGAPDPAGRPGSFS